MGLSTIVILIRADRYKTNNLLVKSYVSSHYTSMISKIVICLHYPCVNSNCYARILVLIRN